MTKNRLVHLLFWALFAAYLFLMLYLLFFMRISSAGGPRSHSLVPFQSIVGYLSGQIQVSASLVRVNVLGNILVFVPLGVYLPILIQKHKLRRSALLVMLCSLCAECIQWIFRLGAADIDDVILNTLGGALGVLAYALLRRLARGDENRAFLWVVVISTVVGTPVLFLAAIIFVVNL